MGPDVEIKPEIIKLTLKSKRKKEKLSIPLSSEKDISVVGTVENPDANIIELYSSRPEAEGLTEKENVSPMKIDSSSKSMPRLSSSSSASSGYLEPMPQVDPTPTSQIQIQDEEPRRRLRGRRGRNAVKKTEEIISVDDSDDGAEEEPPASSSTSLMSDQFRLFEFPPKSKNSTVSKYSVTVCLSDLKSLEYEEYLNDIIIDFYLTYLHHQVLPPEDRAGVHIFSSMFFVRLANTDNKLSQNSHKLSGLGKLTAAQRRHCNVASWTKNLNIFEKNLLVIPICEHSHWYLLLVVKPGLVTTSEETNNNGEPLIIVLDSLGGNKTTAVRYVREYLAEEWAVKLGRDRGQAFKFSAEQMKTVRPTKPEQTNYTDCGIYLLHYVEKIFTSIGQFFWSATLQEATGENWFPVKEIKEKRSQIAKLIIHQAQAENEGKLTFPTLRFESPVRRTSSRRRKRQQITRDDDKESDLDFVLEESQPRSSRSQSGRQTRSREARGLLGEGTTSGAGRLTRKTATAAENNPDEEEFEKSRLELYEKIHNKNKRPSGETVQLKKSEVVEGQRPIKINRKRKCATIPTDPNGIPRNLLLEGQSKVQEKTWGKYFIPKNVDKKKPALKTFLKSMKDEALKVKEKDDFLFDNVKEILLGLESGEASGGTKTKTVQERDGNQEDEEEISIIGGTAEVKDKEGKGEEITILGGPKSRSESPQVLSVTKDIPECGVKMTLTKSPPPVATSIKAKEDIQSDDEFGPSQ